MHIARRFTREGVGPYEGIDFEQRIAKVVTREGATVGTEIPVTVPSSWSQTASEMLATKYLRRAGVPNLRLRQPEDGVPEWLHRHQPYMEATLGSEDDCRQVFHRIAGCYTYHGWKAGYFDAETDARAFYDEIVWMLAHQMAAPNSPVWFSARGFRTSRMTPTAIPSVRRASYNLSKTPFSARMASPVLSSGKLASSRWAVAAVQMCRTFVARKNHFQEEEPRQA